MKKYIMKKLSVGFILSCLVILSLSLTTVASSNSSIQVYYVPLQFTFDESEVAPPTDQQGFLYNNRTYLPLRFVIHSLNQAVGWDGDSYTVTITEPNEELKSEF